MYRSLMVAAIVLLATTVASAQSEQHHAAVVVRYGDGEVASACVAFPEESISGVELLERATLPVVVQAGGIGAAVCKIGADGCDYPTEQCFCERDGPRAIYWAYYVQEQRAWRYASLGAGNTEVHDGDVNGWAWGPGDSGSGAEPPLLSYEQVCGQERAPQPALPAAVATLPATASAAYPTPDIDALAPYPAASLGFYPALPEEVASEPGNTMGGLITFGLFVLVLLGGMAFVLWRQR